MPKTEIDYSNTIFYKIQCNNPDVKDVYIGHTTNFVQRKHAHKRSCTHEKSANHNCKVYTVIREYGGWDNWKMEIIAFHECADHYAARKIEQKYFEEYKATLNSIEPLPKPKVTSPKDSRIKPEKQMLSQSYPHKFNCEKCNYGCSKKGDFNKHILSAKHNAETVGNDYSCSHCAKQFNTRSGLWKHKNSCTYTPPSYSCECSKVYNHRASLYNHKKGCTYTPPSSHEENIQTTIEHVEPNSAELLVLVKELIVQMAAKDKQQDELIKQNMELQNAIKEMIPHLSNNKKIYKKVLPQVKLEKQPA